MASNVSTQNKRIAKNTVYLFVQKIIILLILLYTSRVLLNVLGIDDYGLYGLVGSIVLMFNSLRSLFSSSIQRFINVAKASDDANRISQIYSLGVIIHLCMSVLFIIVLELAASILLPDLNIAPERLSVAWLVLQCSIASAVISLMTVPYDALLMANEKFKVISAFAVIEYALRLGVVFLLYLDSGERIITYALLLVAVSIIVRILNAAYCHIRLRDEARFKFKIDKSLLKEMTGFAGWNFFGNLGYSLANEGVNLILNLFGGIVANAARTITYQVSSAIMQFVAYSNMSFQPRSISTYSEGDFNRFFNLQCVGAKVNVSIFSLIATPIIVFTPYILQFWLGEIPPYTVTFIHALLGYHAIRCLHSPIDTLFKAEGNLRNYQICELSLMVLNLPISWAILKCGAPYWSVFTVMMIIEIINLGAILNLAKRMLDFPVKAFINRVIFRSIIIFAIIGIFGTLGNILSVEKLPFIVFASGTIVVSATIGIISVLTLFDKTERTKLWSMIPILDRFKGQS